MYNNSKNKLVLSVFVIAFATFIVAGLAIVPALLEDVDAERKKPKKPKDHGITLDESLIELLKGGNNKNHDKTKNHQNHDFTINEPVIELVKDKPKKDKKDKDNV